MFNETLGKKTVYFVIIIINTVKRLGLKTLHTYSSRFVVVMTVDSEYSLQ